MQDKLIKSLQVLAMAGTVAFTVDVQLLKKVLTL